MIESRTLSGLGLNLTALIVGLASATGLVLTALSNLSYSNTSDVAPGWISYGLPVVVVVLIIATIVLAILGIIRGRDNRYWVIGVGAIFVSFLGVVATFFVYVLYPGLD